MLLRDLHQEYSRVRLTHCNPHTTVKYAIAIAKLERYLERPATIADLSDENLTLMRYRLLRDGLSRSTANCYVSHLCAMWTYAWRRNYIATGPTVKDIPEVFREPVSFSLNQFSAILRACSSLTYSIDRIPAPFWWRSLLLTLYDTGWRVGATLQLSWADVDLDEGLLSLQGEATKSLKSSRKFVSPETCDSLRKILDPRRRLVWPWDRTEKYFWVKARELFLSADMPDDRRYRLHAIRKTHGTLIAAQLGDYAAADSLQHSSVQTFRKHYRDSSKIDARNVLEVLPRPKAS